MHVVNISCARLDFEDYFQGQLKTLGTSSGTQMGYLIGCSKNSFVKIIDEGDKDDQYLKQ